MVFDKQWFQQNNSKLCWFANAPVIKYWFRWLLRIHNDVSWNTKINRITPNSFSYGAKKVGNKIEVTTDFRTHEKFGKRLYYGLKPLWYLLHFWDWSTQIQPALNCGFDTLTQYPGSTEDNNPVDGNVTRDADESWETKIAGTGTEHNITGGSGVFNIKASATTNQWQTLVRSIFCLDTSSLTSSASISATTFSLYGTQVVDNGTAISPNCDVYTVDVSSTTDISNSDFMLS